MSLTPTVAIVGRPNVGKSTLFNRLIGRRKAIVHDQPGVTRDRITGTAELDDGRPVLLIDTGGLVPGDDPLGLGQQVMLAVEESDVIVFLVDGREGLTTADERVWQELRRQGKPTLLAVNKADTRIAQEGWHEFSRLGIEITVLISAEHGSGIGELFENLEKVLPETTEEIDTDAPRIAIVGRPNVGKSSILNRLLGHERALVSPVAGTTRDPVDSLLTRDGRSYLLVDTAGIRRRAKTTGVAEDLAVMMARRQVVRAELALLVLDASAGVTSGDLSIAGSIDELGRAAVVLVNKWDLLDDLSREKLEESWERLDQILHNPVRVNVSATSGRRLDKIFEPVDETLERFHHELSTSEVNRLFEEAIERHQPPAIKGRPWKVYYSTQVSAGPPTFMLFANDTLPLASSYRRYLENSLRRALDLRGVPTRLVIRKR